MFTELGTLAAGIMGGGKQPPGPVGPAATQTTGVKTTGTAKTSGGSKLVMKKGASITVENKGTSPVVIMAIVGAAMLMLILFLFFILR